jgi:hypothetical protein
MFNTVHYTLRTTSLTLRRVNAVVTYDVFYDGAWGIAYDAELHAPPEETVTELQLMWRAKIVNQNEGMRLEYDCLKRIYYRTLQTIKVESALYNLKEDLTKFLNSAAAVPIDPMTIGNIPYPGKRLYTLTIWYDPERNLPMRRENRDRGHLIVDEFVYHSVNEPLPEERFELPKPAEAIADFDLYPNPPYLPRFETPPDAESPQYGVYVETLLAEIRRFATLNQWEYGPFATIRLPWLTEMPARIYRGRTDNVFPPLVVVVEAPGQEPTDFQISYDFLGYVVTGFTMGAYDLSQYNELPITASLRLEELVPLYAAPSFEKEFVVHNFVTSVQSNDFFITAFDMENKPFDLVIKNFSFHENEGYLILNVYGKEYWDNANIESMFNFVVTGQMADAHTTPIIIYALQSLKRLGIYREVVMPVFKDLPVAPTS